MADTTMEMNVSVSVETSPDRNGVKVNRLALVLLTTLAVIIGVTPALLILDRPLWMLFGSVLVLVGAMVGAFTESTDTVATYPPSWQEFLLAGLGTIFVGASVGIYMLVVAGFGYGVGSLLDAVAGWLRVGLPQQGADLACEYLFGGIVGLLLGLILSVSGPKMMVAQLYPDAAGIRSAFYLLLTVGWRRKMLEYLRSHWLFIIIVTLVVCVCVVYALVALWGRTGAYLALNFALGWCAFPLFVATAIPNHFNESEVQTIKELLEAVGWRVFRPRTGDPASDPLLLELDLLAANDLRTIAVAVRTQGKSRAQATLSNGITNWRGEFASLGAKSSTPVEATTVAALRLAARTCSFNAKRFELLQTAVEPWLIVVDKEITADAKELS